MPHIVSTLTASQEYTDWNKPDQKGANVARPASPIHSVTVRGGANVQGSVLTPGGVVTHVTDEDVAMLKKNSLFLLHEKNGHVKIIDKEAEPDPEKVAKGMKDRDDSAPLNEGKGDFKPGARAGGGPKPKNSKVE